MSLSKTGLALVSSKKFMVKKQIWIHGWELCAPVIVQPLRAMPMEPGAVDGRVIDFMFFST
jgi:hypothetical protein